MRQEKYYVDGYHPPAGVDSRDTVKEYQRSLNVDIDGIWGKETDAAYKKNLYSLPHKRRQKTLPEQEFIENSMRHPIYPSMDSGIRYEKGNGYFVNEGYIEKTAKDMGRIVSILGPTASVRDKLYDMVNRSSLDDKWKKRARDAVRLANQDEQREIYYDILMDGMDAWFSHDAWEQRAYNLFYEGTDQWKPLFPDNPQQYQGAVRKQIESEIKRYEQLQEPFAARFDNQFKHSDRAHKKEPLLLPGYLRSKPDLMDGIGINLRDDNNYANPSPRYKTITPSPSAMPSTPSSKQASPPLFKIPASNPNKKKKDGTTPWRGESGENQWNTLWNKALEELTGYAPKNDAALTQEQRMNIILNSIKYISPYYEYGTKKQYQKDGETYNRIDCSDLVSAMYLEAGIDAFGNTTSRGFAGTAKHKDWYIKKGDINKSTLYPGDIVVWEKNGKVSHVAVYLCTVDGQRWIIESTGSQNGPNVSKEWDWLSENYVVTGYITPEPNKKG